MDFGKAVGTACATFAVTNIDDIFVLVTFFAEVSMGGDLTPLHITIGQYVGFSVIIIVSMIGYGASFLFSPEPIGFLGLLPILLGVWWMFGLLFPSREPEPTSSVLAGEPTDADGESNVEDADTKEPTAPSKTRIWAKNLFKVGSVTVMNGGDNIGTYVPLFSQAKGAEIAVYVVTYYIMLGVWILTAFLIMKQKHILRLAKKSARFVVPFLYLGLGIFIIVESDCYPWSIEQIDNQQPSHPGMTILAVTTSVILLACIGTMLWFKLRKTMAQKRAARRTPETEGVDGGSLELGDAASHAAPSGLPQTRHEGPETAEAERPTNKMDEIGTGAIKLDSDRIIEKS